MCRRSRISALDLAERSAGRRPHRGARARRRAERHGAGSLARQDPRQYRRARRGDEDGQQRRLLAVATCRRRSHHHYRHAHVSWLRAIVDAFETLLTPRTTTSCASVGPAPMGGEFLEIVLWTRPLRQAMLRYSRNILLLSLVISGITATLVYLTLHYHVRAADAARHRQHDRVPRRSRESDARDRAVRPARRDRHRRDASSPPCRPSIASMLQQKSRLASLGLAVSKINHDLRNLLSTSAQLFSDRLAKLPDPGVQRFAPKLMRALERAIAFCQSTLSYGRVQEPPPERRQIPLEPLVEEVRETLGLGARCADPLDRRDRARARGRRRPRPAVARAVEPLAQRRAGAGERARRSDPGARPDPHHRPARGRGRGDRGVRYRARAFPTRRARICSRRSRARPVPAAPASGSRSPPSSCAPMAAKSAWSRAPSARRSGSPFRTAPSSLPPIAAPARRVNASLPSLRANWSGPKWPAR